MVDAGNTLSLKTGTVLEDYRIDGVLGKGGFAITYSGVDQRLKKRVAIKELLPDGIATRVGGDTVVPQTETLRPDYDWAIDSFLKEAQTLAGFEHPNIVRVSRFFKKNGTAYMVMPFIEGCDLKQLIKQRGTFNHHALLEILNPLLGALKLVHSAGVLHRDIKPENIYITSHGAPILIDFGAARQQVGGKSLDVTSIITPGYASIEQYSTDAKYQGPWSDIYSLGACIYQLITGRKPAPASERNDAARNGRPDPLVALSVLKPQGFPSQFLAGVDQALQMSELERPRDIESWRHMLGIGGGTSSTVNSMTSLPGVTGNRQPSAAKVRRGSNKKLKILVAAILLVVAIGLGAGTTVWVFVRNAQEKKAAKKQEEQTGGEKAVTERKPADTGDGNRPVLIAIEDAIEDGDFDKALRLIRELDRKVLPAYQRSKLADLRDMRDKEMKNCPAFFSFQTSTSNVRVYVDGARVSSSSGKYPLRGIGKHRVRISASGYDDHLESIDVYRKNQVVSLGRITLNPDEHSRVAKRAADAAAAAAAERAREEERRKEAARRAEQDKQKHEATLKKELLRFVDDYYTRMPSNDLNVLVGLYANRVDYEYYRKGQLISRQQLANSLSENTKRWPNRSYQPMKTTYKVLNAAQTRVIIYFGYGYSYSNRAGKRAKGSAFDDVTLEKIGGRWQIVKWRQGVKRVRNDLKGL